MRERPPMVLAEGDTGDKMHELLEEVHGRRDPEELEVELLDYVLAFCPPASRVPYEVMVTNPYLRGGLFDSDHVELELALLVLRNVVRRLRAVEGAVPWNAWLHADESWHIEFVPRLTIFAGIELGAGIYVNTLAPEEAARALRGAAPPAFGTVPADG